MSDQSVFLTDGYEQPVNQNTALSTLLSAGFSTSVKIEVTSNIYLLGTILDKVVVI